MSTVKKIVIGVFAVILVFGAVAGGAVYFKKSRQETVPVVQVESIASDYYTDDTMLEGNIVTNVTQNVNVDKDMIIQQVYVNEGDSVSKGDKLISFDMTLVQMELNIARLKKQQQEQDLEKAVNRLTSLKNGGPIEEETDDAVLDTYSDTLDTGDDTMDDDLGDDELASADTTVRGSYLAAVMRPVLAAAEIFGDGTGELSSSEAEPEASAAESPAPAAGDGQETVNSQNEPEAGEDQVTAGGQDDTFTDQETPPNVQEPSENPEDDSGVIVDFGSGESGTAAETPAPSVQPEPTPSGEDPGQDITGDIVDGVEIIDTEPSETTGDFMDGEPVFYQKLDADTEPFTGTGTEEDPFVFLCSSAKGKVVATGAFLNKMAGFLEDGTKEFGVNGYWYQLEFHQDDTITDFENRKESCTGYYLIDGSLLENMVNEFAEVEFTLAEASQYEDEYDYDEGGDYGQGMDGDDAGSLTRDEAIKQQETRIESLKLDIRESELNIGKLEKKVQNEVIYSKLDGVVDNVGDPLTGTSDESSFMSVKSKDGYYVSGTVSELMLDQVKEGTKLTCSGQNGSFEAEVIEVSDYPVSSDSYMGSGNPNVSYYTYSASILDQSAAVSEDDWLTITLQNSQDNSNSLVLDRAFVRTENGVNYVYKDVDGVLKKQVLTVGGNVNGGYSVLITGGLTREDKIAFPYGDSAKEGAKTKDSTLEELYGY